MRRPLNMFNDLLQIGAMAGLSYKQNLREESGWPIFPYVLPFIQTNFGWRLNVRSIWVPPVREKTDNQFVFQLLVEF